VVTSVTWAGDALYAGALLTFSVPGTIAQALMPAVSAIVRSAITALFFMIVYSP
jgi:hypothetical protein